MYAHLIMLRFNNQISHIVTVSHFCVLLTESMCKLYGTTGQMLDLKCHIFPVYRFIWYQNSSHKNLICHFVLMFSNSLVIPLDLHRGSVIRYKYAIQHKNMLRFITLGVYTSRGPKIIKVEIHHMTPQTWFQGYI